MKKIGLISDTHAFLEPKIYERFAECDEIWHAGDIGCLSVADNLAAFKPLRAVHGNIDGYDVRLAYPKVQQFECEGVKVLMTHIGGFPGRYDREAYRHIMAYKPQLFICGHSHILRVMYDKSLDCLCVNPGAIGHYGAQAVRTMLRFEIDGHDIRNMEIIELSKQ
ncbi:MAG: metallophosphatase family protein [Paludibacteraceae bacterium]|nr:metallophosphatase family protein [Paludibacteraceae bacterium]